MLGLARRRAAAHALAPRGDPFTPTGSRDRRTHGAAGHPASASAALPAASSRAFSITWLCRSAAHGRDSWTDSVSLRRHPGARLGAVLPVPVAGGRAPARGAAARTSSATSIRCRWRPSSTAATTTGMPAEQPLGAPGDLEATIAQVRRLNAAAVVVAGEGMTADYLAELQKTGTLVMAFDSTAEHRPSRRTSWSTRCWPRAGRPTASSRARQLLLGHKFALCRGIFRRQRTIRATEPPAPFRRLVAIGDDDLTGRPWPRSGTPGDAEGGQGSVAVRTHHPRYDDLKDLAAASTGGSKS